MSIFAAAAILISLTALVSYLNERFLRLPPAIGVMVGALVASLLVLMAGHFGLAADGWAEGLLLEIDFDELLMKGMLSFLLFAGALHVNLDELRQHKWPVLTLATFGVLLSTFLVGSATWWVLGRVGLPIPYVWALVFGALISPTDPIAVLALLKQAGTSKRLQSLITGESLFNDGVGVVVFTAILGIAAGTHQVSAGEIGTLFLSEAIGGLIFGLGLGLVAYTMLKTVDNPTVEILITLALVQGGYSLALAFHTSGPIAMVVAGLLIGNHGRSFAMSDRTRENLDRFWELLDEILNAVLFLLIGLEVLIMPFSPRLLAVGLVAIPLVLLARFLAVGASMSALWLRRLLPPYTTRLMTWGGLRGGISVALALSLPPSPHRDVILLSTYVVVVFSLVVQGLTVGRLARWARTRTRGVASRPGPVEE